MKTEQLNVEQYFKETGFEWRSYEKKVTEICFLTKTRTKINKWEQLGQLLGWQKKIGVEEVNLDGKRFEMTAGMEQPFLLMAIAKRYNAKHIFEIGTGRGTGAYAMSLLPEVKHIQTVDIIKFGEKRWTTVGNQSVWASNRDIFELMDLKSKEKIEFWDTEEAHRHLQEETPSVQMAFIDGNHSDREIVEQDFQQCLKLVKKGGVIVWDDYGNSQFVVTEVADQARKEWGFKCRLVEFHGHLFNGSKSPGIGDLIMEIN